MEHFGARGVEATSIRDVAAAADVSPPLVLHHFGNKAGLRDAVNEYVISVARDLFEQLESEATLGEMGDRATATMRENEVILRYVGRALIDGDPRAFTLFDALVALARDDWLQREISRGAVHPDVDCDWAAMHIIIFNLATVLFERAIDHHLSASVFSDEEAERWNQATTDLYRRGFFRTGEPSAPPTRKRR